MILEPGPRRKFPSVVIGLDVDLDLNECSCTLLALG